MTNHSDCFETIRIDNGVIQNLDYHNARCNKTRASLYHQKTHIKLQDYLTAIPTNGIFKAKVIYNHTINHVSYIPYTPKQIKYFHPIEADIKYSFKYLDRSSIDMLMTRLKADQEVIIIQDGLITDTSIANMAIKHNNIWYTPSSPLLEGTTRARLLDTGQIRTADITMADLKNADGFALMNAMIGFKQITYKDLRDA